MIAQKTNEKILCLHRSTASTKSPYISLLWRQWKRGSTNLLKIFALLLMLAANSGGVEAQSDCTMHGNSVLAFSWIPRYSITEIEGFGVEQFVTLAESIEGDPWWSETMAIYVFGEFPNAYTFDLFDDNTLIGSILVLRDYERGVDYVWRGRGIDDDGAQHGCMTAIMSSADVDALVSEVVNEH